MFCQLFNEILQKITNVTQITKVGAHVKTSGWIKRYLAVFTNVISEYRGSVKNVTDKKLHMLFK